MIHLREFSSHADYEAAKEGLVLPNVSIDGEHVHYNKKVVIIVPSNEIWYKTVDGEKMHYTSAKEYVGYEGAIEYLVSEEGYQYVGLDLISEEKNEYGYWVLKFDETVENVGEYTNDGGDKTYFYTPFDTAGESIKEMLFPESVTNINYRVLMWCTNLLSINIPKTISVVGIGSYFGCTKLVSVEIPNNITKIEQGAFYKCTGLESVVIPDSVTTIEFNSFSMCSSLSNIEYKGTISQWGSVTKGAKWNDKTPATVVHCIDGDVAL